MLGLISSFIRSRKGISQLAGILIGVAVLVICIILLAQFWEVLKGSSGGLEDNVTSVVGWGS